MDFSLYIGGKPIMSYVTNVVMYFTTQGAESVIIKSRGKFISSAVEVAEVIQKQFLKDKVKIGDVKIDSQELTAKDGKKVRVSTMEITLTKAQ
ncbi:MAG: DNA-binding protein Alba [Nanoarchaeota archaeon]|mgnify:CR=1 FL=1